MFSHAEYNPMSKISHLPTAAATLDIDVLKTLVAIAETGSVTAAAARVARSPGAVSMQVKKLEETLGRTLFERSRQGMALNADGERLLAYARRMVDLHREALDAFRGPQLSGEVRIGTIDDLGIVRLSEVMAAFARSHPNVVVNVDMGPSAALGPKLERGELDLAILTPGCAVPWRTTDLILHDEPLVWVGRDGGRAVRERPLPLALSAPGCAWRQAALEALERGGVAYRIAYTSEFYEGQKAAIQADLAIAPMPRSLIGPGLMQIRSGEGLGEIGSCRIALRLGPDPSTATLALAERVTESYGAAWPEAGAA
jgi:DNA-binding transcriptional LysR family regulator